MQGGWQPPPGGGGYGPPGGYGGPPSGGMPPGGPPGGGPPGYGAPPGYGQPPSPSFAPNPYGGGAPQPQMYTPQYGNYEFNDYENSIIDKAAGRMKLWGIISTVIGGLQVLGSCGAVANPSLGSYLPAGIIAIVVGVTFIGSGNSLKNVVQTQGNDMMHLSQAMQKLGSAFMIQIVCALIAFVFVVLAVLLLMFVFAAAAATR